MDLEKDNGFNLNQKDWFENLSKEEREEIETGLQQTEENEFVEHEEVMKRFSKYKTQKEKLSPSEP
ncbi:hypothetical protein [Flavobacterium branchiicola]|uniref:Uncharacterized protein n=1 Tax=Flavobacterium branchiicola TaxID=1114875 RepID=A0ABV9P9U3_9FLAO|nr:hypothetical protein [Flavobacterium branchiicola]MBS7252828.1 hypothetical protein [Flavobacterium branchiicola]